MKKRILFLHNRMVMGGLEKVLLNLIKALGNDFEVSLGLISVNDGELVNFVPSKVKKFRLSNDEKFLSDFRTNVSTKQEIICNIKKFKILSATKILIKKIFHRPLPYKKGNWNNQPVIPQIGEFDVAVCYDIKQTALIKYCAEKVIAKKRVIWIHDDLSQLGFRKDMIKPWINKFDYLFVNGKYAYKSNLKVLKGLEEKIKITYNVIDFEDIYYKAKLINDSVFEFTDFNGFKIVSVGTLVFRKGYDIVLEVAQLLKSDDLNFKWYIIGDGELFGLLKAEIDNLGLSNHVYLLGNCYNPYVYMNNADVIVHCARHESYCTVLAEARVLHKFIISTEVGGADEIIKDGVNGFIANSDANDIFKKIRYYLINMSKNSDIDLSYNLDNTDADKLFNDIINGNL